jgi:hypothetical protein
MNLWTNMLFYTVFLGQIFLISWFVPKWILARIDLLMQRCPPSTHPRLYPKPPEYYRIGRALFQWGNHALFGLGFMVLLGVILLDDGSVADDGYISEAWPAAYGILQFLPMIALELMGYGQFRLMRAMDAASTRRADLQPRRLLDLVSPGLLVFAVGLMLAVIGIDLHLNDYVVDFGRDATQRGGLLLGTNLFLLLQGVWLMRGRKRDPFQDAHDRKRQISIQLTSLLLVSVAVSLFMLSQTADDVFDLDYLDAPLMSLYFQLLVGLGIGNVLRNASIDQFNFDVYRDPSVRRGETAHS